MRPLQKSHVCGLFAMRRDLIGVSLENQRNYCHQPPFLSLLESTFFLPKKNDPELLRLLWYPERPANTKSPTSCCAAGMLNVFLCSCTRQLLLCYSLKCMSDDWNLINSLRIMILWCIWLCKHLVGSCFFFFLFFCSTLRFSSETVNTYYFASFWSVGY